MFDTLRNRAARIEASRQMLEHSESRSRQIQKQWPEVTKLSTWARETREHNHLTELFLHGRRAR